MDWMHAGSLFFLTSVCDWICTFILIPLKNRRPQQAPSPVLGRVKTKGKLRLWPAVRTEVLFSPLPGMPFYPFFSHTCMWTLKGQRSPFHRVPAVGWYRWVQFLSAAVTCVVAVNSGGHAWQQEQPFPLSSRPTSERVVSLLLSNRQHLSAVTGIWRLRCPPDALRPSEKEA